MTGAWDSYRHWPRTYQWKSAQSQTNLRDGAPRLFTVSRRHMEKGHSGAIRFNIFLTSFLTYMGQVSFVLVF